MKDIYDMKIGESFYLKRTVAVISERNNRPCEYDEERIDVNALIIEELEKIKEEIQGLIDFEESCCGNTTLGYECLGVIENKISELKGDKKMNKELKTVKIGMESDFIIVNKDFIIKKFEKIKSEMIQERDSVDLSCADSFNWNIRLIDKHIAELKGETK